MSYKYFGKLAGTTPAPQALADTSPANTTTPFQPNAPATKFMSYGEDATSAAFNRAFGALSTNLDSLKGVMDAPALREEVLTPIRISSDNPVSSGGFWPLTERGNLFPLGVHTGQAELDLSGDYAGNGPPNTVPAKWVYLGLHQRELARFVRLYGADTGKTLYETREQADLKLSVTPAQARASISGSLYFPNTEYIGQDDHAIPYSIPPITPISVELAPYNGVSKPVDIFRWESDGVTTRGGSSFSDLYLRPGCYVEIQNDGDPNAQGNSNNGLYQIAGVRQSDSMGAGGAGDKAVLTRGNLSKVTVGDYTTYEDGDLVAWKPFPDHNDPVSAPSDRTMYAHVVYRIPRPDLPEVADFGDVQGDLYLACIGAGEDFNGKSVDASNFSFQGGGRRAYGDVGLPDAEEGADSNWTMPKGTLLWRYDTVGAVWEREEVTDVVSASAPVHFRLDKNPGQMVPCNPLGFLLNPTLVFEPGNQPLKQDYYLYCNTLTTVGEQLRSQGAGAARGVYEDAASRLNTTYGDLRQMEDFLTHIHVGHNQYSAPTLSGKTPQLGGGFSPTRNVLGDDLWHLRLEQTAGAADTFQNVCLANGVGDGDQIVVLHPDGPAILERAAFGKIVRVSDNEVVIRELFHNPTMDNINNSSISLKQTTGDENQVIISADQGYGAYSTIELTGGYEWKVANILSGSIMTSTHSGTLYFTPTTGLNAAYHNDYSSNPYLRGQWGSGSMIAYSDNDRPITLVMSDDMTSDHTAIRVASDLDDDDGNIRLIYASSRTDFTGSELGGISLWWARSHQSDLFGDVGSNYARRCLTFTETNGFYWLSANPHLGIVLPGSVQKTGPVLPLSGTDSLELAIIQPKPATSGVGYNTSYGPMVGGYNYQGTPTQVSTYTNELSCRASPVEKY